MAIDIRKLAEARQPERDAAKEHSQDAVVALELRYIADSMEAIRGELAVIAQLIATAARGKPPI